MRKILTVLALLALGVLGASHLGRLHPVGDSLAAFREILVPVALIGSLILLMQKRKVLAIGAVVLAGWSAYTVLAPRFLFSAALDTPYSMYQKNMLFRMPSVDPLRRDIENLKPDFISLQEVSKRNLPILAGIAKDYPSQVYCSFSTVGGVAVASKWPMVKGSKRCPNRGGMAAMQVETPGGPVWVVSLHLHWPYPKGQAAHVDDLLPHLQGLDGPVVLGGDFNMVPWSHTMARITAATGSRRIGATKYSFPIFRDIYTLPLDHILVNANARPADTTKRPLLGSDHFGVFGRFYIR